MISGVVLATQHPSYVWTTLARRLAQLAPLARMVPASGACPIRPQSRQVWGAVTRGALKNPMPCLHAPGTCNKRRGLAQSESGTERKKTSCNPAPVITRSTAPGLHEVFFLSVCEFEFAHKCCMHVSGLFDYHCVRNSGPSRASLSAHGRPAGA